MFALMYIPINLFVYTCLAQCRAATMKLHRGHTARVAKDSLSAMGIVFIISVMLYLRYVARPSLHSSMRNVSYRGCFEV